MIYLLNDQELLIDLPGMPDTKKDVEFSLCQVGERPEYVTDSGWVNGEMGSQIVSWEIQS